MLQVKNLTKIYKTKGGADVKALDEVSVHLPETGMVFLLGKSGSGKSTLLNVCGGLDDPTSGEIIVKGRSSKDFTQSDFDSYRNTFVGFIFQEYNILNEFSVEDNIALALELQGKAKDKDEINKLLEDVDLLGYAKRKPNTLSGGQKQRIAIARALIKSPQIIMADEPTGALDSVTGKQVLDTLKKLSKDKLVVVVSHDREFAEFYGDRIIELKDGKIISDVSKCHESQKQITKNISTIGETLCIKQGSDLDDKDFEKIKTFLKDAKSDILIATGEKDVKSFKEVNRINDNGQREVFNDTKEKDLPQKQYTAEDSLFIRSKLPLRHAFKIGASGLKTKPLRLIFTIFLCTIAFVMFGMLSTLTFYNQTATFRQTLKDSNYDFITIEKRYQLYNTSYENGEIQDVYTFSSYAKFSKEDVENLANQYGAYTFGTVESSINFAVEETSNYYLNSFRHVAYLAENHPLREEIVGRYPQTENEICISSYIADVMLNCNLIDANNVAIQADSHQDLIGKRFQLGYGYVVEIVGIINCSPIPQRFDVLKDQTDNFLLVYELQSELYNSLHSIAFLTENAVKEFVTTGYSMSYLPFQNRYLTVNSNVDEYGNLSYPEDWIGNAVYAGVSNSEETIYYANGVTSLGDNQILVHKDLYLNYLVARLYLMQTSLQQQYDHAINDIDLNYFIEQLDAHPVLDGDDLVEFWMENSLYGERQETIPQPGEQFYDLYLEWQVAFGDVLVVHNQLQEVSRIERFCESLLSHYYWDDSLNQMVSLHLDQREQYIDEVFDFCREIDFSFDLNAKILDYDWENTLGAELQYQVVGFFGFDNVYNNGEILLSDAEANRVWEIQKDSFEYYSEVTTNYVPTDSAYIDTVFLAYDHSEQSTDTFVDIYLNRLNFDENDEGIRMNNALVSNFEMVDMMIENLEEIFLYAGLVIALFSALLLSNFISISISYKKKEIGILRAVGARSIDVFKIFFAESIVITGICVLLSTIGSLIVCHLVNMETTALIGVSIFVFGLLSFLVLVTIALVTAFVSTILPVYHSAKKKPVDSIRAL